MLPVAILAGGLATRLRPTTEKIPKSLLEVNGEPFIESDDPKIVSSARAIVGQRRDAGAAARALVAWVNENLDHVTVESGDSTLVIRRDRIIQVGSADAGAAKG